jgi:hypothetical protein
MALASERHIGSARAGRGHPLAAGTLFLALISVTVIHGNHAAAQAVGALAPIARAQMCVTEGAIEASADGLWSVEAPKMRAYLNQLTTPVIEARFRYLGATGEQARLGSGALRAQFGLKLRAQDACNLVYAMWRIEPEEKLVVSVKSNPGQHSSAECGNRGYRNIKPAHGAALPALSPGSANRLRAEMSGPQLRVFADERLVWEGSVGADALAFNGPVGIRSDNTRLQLALYAGAAIKPSDAPPACRSGPGESE